MGGVIISPNIKKESVRISREGQEFDPKTRQPLPTEQPYVPTAEEVKKAHSKPVEPLSDIHPSPSSPIQDAVRDAVQKKVDAEVAKAMEGVDIGAMVADAIQKALK